MKKLIKTYIVEIYEEVDSETDKLAKIVRKKLCDKQKAELKKLALEKKNEAKT